MSVTSISPILTTRFREAQEVLSFIRQHESSPGTPDPAEIILLRGLFYVHLYGAFEFSINRIVLTAVQEINQAQVPHQKITHSLGVLVLDGAFKSVVTCGSSKQWPKRLDLIQLRLSNAIASIDDGAVDLQNIWLHTLEQIFAAFGINKPVMYDVTKAGYVRELVDTRNKIAHGRESPDTAGRARNSTALQKLHDAIRDETFYVLDCFDEYIKNREYEI